VEAEVTVDRVEVTETRNGNRRFVVRDGDGKEYTTFRPQIGNEAAKHEGRRARIKFHEEQRGAFTNVYLGSRPTFARATSVSHSTFAGNVLG
jgi:hypothetical protein